MFGLKFVGSSSFGFASPVKVVHRDKKFVLEDITTKSNRRRGYAYTIVKGVPTTNEDILELKLNYLA